MTPTDEQVERAVQAMRRVDWLTKTERLQKLARAALSSVVPEPKEGALNQRREEHQRRVEAARVEIGDMDAAMKRIADFLGPEGMQMLSDWVDDDTGLREDTP